MNGLNGLQHDGVWIHEPAHIKAAVEAHFRDIFNGTWSNRPFPEQISLKQVSMEDNNTLISPFSEEEIREVVCQCDGSKSPGPDGFNFKFIKNFWDTKEDFIAFLSEFHANGRLAKGSNSSFLTLIPKIASPQQLSHYRPI